MSTKEHKTDKKCKHCGNPMKHYNFKSDRSEEVWDSCDTWIEIGSDPETAQVEKCKGNVSYY